MTIFASNLFVDVSINVIMFHSPERFFQSSVITSEATAMDTTGSTVGSVVDTSDDIAPDKPAPDLRSPWSHATTSVGVASVGHDGSVASVGSVGPVISAESDAPVSSVGSIASVAPTATVLRWTPAPLPHWRPVSHRTV